MCYDFDKLMSYVHFRVFPHIALVVFGAGSSYNKKRKAPLDSSVTETWDLMEVVYVMDSSAAGTDSKLQCTIPVCYFTLYVLHDVCDIR